MGRPHSGGKPQFTHSCKHTTSWQWSQSTVTPWYITLYFSPSSVTKLLHSIKCGLHDSVYTFPPGGSNIWNRTSPLISKIRFLQHTKSRGNHCSFRRERRPRRSVAHLVNCLWTKNGKAFDCGNCGASGTTLPTMDKIFGAGWFCTKWVPMLLSDEGRGTIIGNLRTFPPAFLFSLVFSVRPTFSKNHSCI